MITKKIMLQRQHRRNNIKTKKYREEHGSVKFKNTKKEIKKESKQDNKNGV